MGSPGAGRANVAQAEGWSGPGGRHWIKHQAVYDRMQAPFGDALLGAAELTGHDAVLDVGCGTGTLALAAGATARTVLGVDLSAPFVARAEARARAAGARHVEFQVADAQTVALAARFDAVLSRFGLMFFDDPAAALANLRRALAPGGGRLAAVCWQGLAGNDWMRVPGEALAQVVPLGDLAEPGQPGPFSLADPGRLVGVLEAAGWRDVRVDDVRAPVVFVEDGTVEDAVAFLRGGSLVRSVLGGATPDVERRALDALRDALAPRLVAGRLALSGSAWLVRATGAPR